MSKTFCPIPWMFMAARSNGDVRVCCQANVTKNKGVIRKPDGTAYNAGRDDLVESRNAEMMKAMRVNMLNGIWSEECGRCRSEEENGLDSRRKYELDKKMYSFERAVSETAEDGTIDVDKTEIMFYDLRFGNFCNLKCRMCGPTDSDSWYDDYMKLTGTDSFWETSGPVKIYPKGNKLVADGYDWPNYEPFWEFLEKNAKNIKHVYFAGGEPMLIERHYDFLERCVDQGVAKNIVIEYNTNMSTLPTRVTELWKNFKMVQIGASVDGMGPVLEYQRNPAKWDKTLRNLKTVDGLPMNIMSWLAVTVTAYNVNHLIDFMKWKLQESEFKRISSTKKRPIMTHHVAHHPKHLNIRVLPDKMKSELTQKYEDFVVWVEEQGFPEYVIEAAKHARDSICSYMNSDSYHADHWDEFVDYTNKLDKIRNESLIEVEPMFKEYINEF